jgi:hypothetical protein
VEGDATEFQKAIPGNVLAAARLQNHPLPDYVGIEGQGLRQGGASFIEVLLILNHTNIDGGSAKTFHKDLLQNRYEGPYTPRSGLLRDHILTFPANLTAVLSSPAEDLVRFLLETRHMVKFF